VPTTLHLVKTLDFITGLSKKGSLGVDAFAHSWSGECVFAAPHVSLVVRTIRKAASAMGMIGILIISLWKNAKFWTFAFKDGTHLNQMFESVQIVGLHTFAWEFARKDVIGERNSISRIKIWSCSRPKGFGVLAGKRKVFQISFRQRM
jgi:hypothetical protein